MKVSLIAALAKNGVIGRDNQLPWQVKDDMRFFVEKTRGHAVITGRKNFAAVGRPLPGRRNLVVSREVGLELAGAEVTRSIEDALRRAEDGGESEAFVIGGAQIYALALPFAHTFYRTTLESDVVGDVVFPSFDEAEWTARTLFTGRESERNEHAFVVEELTRKSAPRSFHEGADGKNPS